MAAGFVGQLNQDVSSEERIAQQVAALLSEREGYERRGLPERVRAVDVELHRLGHGGLPPAKRATKRKAVV